LHAIEHTIFNATPNWGVKNDLNGQRKEACQTVALSPDDNARISLIK